ncbi:MAG: AI-2E family transporter [Bacteroidales bacterium]|nr:AI-2E family transporter [Bacteroidales bacterium]
MEKYRKYIIGFIGLAILIAFCIYFSNIVWWLLISAFIAAISSPIVKLLDKIHFGRFQMPRWVSAMITTILIWGVLVLFVALTIPFIGSQVKQFQNIDVESLQTGLNQPIETIDKFVQSYPILGMPEFSTEDIIVEKIQNVINFSAARNFIGNIGSTALSLFMALFSITFFTYFFLKETKLFRSGIMVLVPTRYEDKATHILDKLPKLIKNYLHGIFFEMLSVTTLITIGLLICGQNFGLSLMIGIICGFLNIIPYIGPWIGAAIGIVFIGAANVNLDFYTYTMPQIYGLLIVVVVVRLIDDFVFQPFFYSRSVNAHPLEIFIVIVVAGTLYGIIGMMLAIPVYTVLRVIAKEFLSEYKIVRTLTRGIDDEKPQKAKEITNGATPQKRPNRRHYRRRPNKQATVDKKE